MDIIVTLVLVVLPVLILALALFVGRKRNIYQSAVRFGAVFLSTLAGILIVNLFYEPVISLCDSLTKGMLPEDFSSFIHELPFFHDLLGVISSIVAPLLFVVAFLLFLLIFGVTAVILSSKLLSDEALARRKAAKPTSNENSENVAPSASDKTANWKPIALRIASLLITAVSVFGILSMLASPLTVYTGLINQNNSSLHALIGDSSNTETADMVFDIAAKINVHPVNRIYATFNNLATHEYAIHKSHTGSSVDSFETISSLLHVAETITNLHFEHLSGREISNLATELDKNDFVKEVADGILSYASKAWIDGTDFLGVEAPVIIDQETTHDLLFVFQTHSGVSALRTLGNTLSILETLNGEDEEEDVNNNVGNNGNTGNNSGSNNAGNNNTNNNTGNNAGNNTGNNQNDKKPVNKEKLTEKFNILLADSDETSVVLMEKIVTSSLANTVVDQTPMKVDIIATVVKTAAKVQENAEIDTEKKTELIQEASSSLTEILAMAQKPEETSAKELVDAVVESEVLIEAIVIETQNGTKKDVLGVAESLPDNAEEEVDIALKEAGYDADSVEYQSIMAAISKQGKK